MKKLKLFIIFLTISSFAFSQNLTPIVQKLDGDTVFCFTINQSKLIAQQIQGNVYCDSLLIEQQNLVSLLGKVNQTKDSIQVQLATKMTNLEQINLNQLSSINLLKKTIEVKNKQLKQSKAHKILFGIGAGIITVFAIAT